MSPAKLTREDALYIVDVQKDFCPPGGALPVTDCSRVLEILNGWIDAAERAEAVIVASRDWHPPNHMSFASQGGPWPRHCVQGTEGANFCDELRLPQRAIVASKGVEPDVEQYSAFQNSDLAEQLSTRGVQRLWVGGVATDVCVRETVLDALRAGFVVHVIAEATAPVDKARGRQALREIEAAGAILE